MRFTWTDILQTLVGERFDCVANFGSFGIGQSTLFTMGADKSLAGHLYFFDLRFRLLRLISNGMDKILDVSLELSMCAPSFLLFVRIDLRTERDKVLPDAVIRSAVRSIHF